MTNLRSDDGTIDALRDALAGQYVLERPFGAGAMGKVFLGRDVTLDRPVAVKVINPDLAASATFRERFLLEARTVAKLRHPNIVAVHSAGEVAGHLYFVMEYVAGESLRDLIDRTKRVDADKARSILSDVAEALAYAHAQGVVHRDVKPENVLLDNQVGRAMLTDFGIARAFASADDDRLDKGRLTGTGLLVGSPRYMSPEQASGERALDGRSDIYTLGLVGYEMLVGESPYAGSSAASMIAKQVTEPAPPVAKRAPDVPIPLAGAIDRALEKDPADRWPDAAAMAAAIRGESGDGYPSRRRPARGRRWMPLVGAVSVILAVAVVFGLMPRSAADDGRQSFLVMPFGVIRGDQSLDWLRQGSVDMLTRNLGQWRDVNVIDYEHTLDLLREANLETAQTIGLQQARELAQQGGANTLVLGQIQRNNDSLGVVARVYDVESGKLTKEIPVGGPASADARWLFDELANQLLGLAGATPTQRKVQVAKITTASVEAYRHYLNGARALHSWELDAADSAFGLATAIDSTFALAYYKRAQTQGWRQAADTLSRHYARMAAANAERLPARERALVEGLLDLEEGNHPRAQQRFGALLAQDSSDAEAWYGYGDAWFHAPRKVEEVAPNFTRALRAFNRAIALDSSFHLAYAHVIEIYSQVSAPNFAWILEGDTLRYLSSEDEARRLGRAQIERARSRARDLAIQTALHWVDVDAAAAPAYQRLADAYAAAQRYDEAVATLERAMRQPATRNADFPYRIATYQLPRQPAQALATLREAMRVYGPDSLSRRGSANRFGALLAATNVTMQTGALSDLDRLLGIMAAVDPLVPGTLRARRPAPTASMTTPLRIGVRAVYGVDEPRDRRAVDSTISRLDAIPEPAGKAARAQAWGLAYAAYVISEDPKYLDVLRRWRGADPPPALRALVALNAGDSTRAREIAGRMAPPDTSRLITPPNEVDDPLSRARVLTALGQERAALQTLEAVRPDQFSVVTPDTRWAMYPRSLLERGALYERLGDRTKAAESYQRYLDLMRDADPVLRPQRQLTQARLTALRDAPVAKLAPRPSR